MIIAIAVTEKGRLTMPELKPCPLCGAEVFIEVVPPHKHFLVNLPDYGGGAFIECPKCSCAVAGKTEQEVIQRWNRRIKDVNL